MRCSLQSILEYNKAISSCAKSTEWQAALQLFADLDLKGFQATVVTYNSAINACAQAANWRSAMLLLKNLDGTGLQANIISYSTAITSCEKAGQWQVAVVLLEDLKLKRLQLNIIAFNAVITACAKGCLHDSLGLVNLVVSVFQWPTCFEHVGEVMEVFVPLAFPIKMFSRRRMAAFSFFAGGCSRSKSDGVGCDLQRVHQLPDCGWPTGVSVRSSFTESHAEWIYIWIYIIINNIKYYCLYG